MEIFNNEEYKFISNFIEEKISILKENEKFNKKYTRLSDAIDELENTLPKEQKEKFNEIIKLFYEVEEYYFAYSYSLGVKYGEDLNKI